LEEPPLMANPHCIPISAHLKLAMVQILRVGHGVLIEIPSGPSQAREDPKTA